MSFIQSRKESLGLALQKLYAKYDEMAAHEKVYVKEQMRFIELQLQEIALASAPNINHSFESDSSTW